MPCVDMDAANHLLAQQLKAPGGLRFDPGLPLRLKYEPAEPRPAATASR